MTVTGDDRLHFDATLRPHRSLGMRGFRTVMVIAVLFSAAAGIVFVSMGAWPVLGFFGLDLLLLYFAFAANYRAAGRQSEHIRLTDRALTVTRNLHGRTNRWSFQPYWVRVQYEEGEDGHASLHLASHGRRLGIANFLPLPERRDLADALNDALRRQRTLPGTLPASGA